MRTLSWLVCLALAAGTSAIVAATQQRPPIIDMHMHAHLPEVSALRDQVARLEAKIDTLNLR